MLLDPNPRQFPPAWAAAWGEDSYGLWAAIEMGGVRQVLRWIVPGEFAMGSPQAEPEREADETQHPVTLSRGYWLGETAVTQGLWQAVMGENPSHFSDDLDNPVEQVSWEDCMDFVEQANGRLPGGLRLRLPSEAEWEYACRAGSQAAFSWGDSLKPDQANYEGNYPYNEGKQGEYRQRTVPVRWFEPNAWGLYQMHGNVYEWCADWYGDYPWGPVTDPAGPPNGRERVLRGGSWIDFGRRLRSAARNAGAPGLRHHSTGLRLAGVSDPAGGVGTGPGRGRRAEPPASGRGGAHRPSRQPEGST